MRRPLAITLALFALLYIVCAFRYAPPAVAPADAPRDRFSASRAADVHQRLVGDGATRFVGTEGNARARDLILSELRRVGWTVETQRATSCTHHGMCAPIVNVIAQLPGREPAAPAVLVSAHYDSVPVSPGASDDGVGTAAVLETARALSEGPRPRRTVVALLDDGEEAGLLGAQAFARAHPLAKSIGTTVNVDARGSRGPSQMFETTPGNAWLVSLMARHLDRPVTTSLFYEVYKRMPNDTDFSATKTIASGVNFANTAGIEHYHTPLDALAVADPRTLQHHGDNVLAMTRALAESGDEARSPGADDVWFDVLALGIVHWPVRFTLSLALAALVLVGAQTMRARRRDAKASSDANASANDGPQSAAWVAPAPARGFFVFLPTLAAAGAAAALMGWILRVTHAVPAIWVAHPEPALIAIHASAAAALLGVAMMFAARATPRALWAGTWLGWGVLGVISAVVAPGASYLFVVPTLIAGLAGALPIAVACAVPAVASALLVLALATGLYDALGFAVPALVAVPTLLVGTTLAPMLAGLPRVVARRGPAALALVALVALVGALATPKFSSSHPQRANVVFRQDDGHARIFVDTSWGPASWGTPPASMLAALGPSSQKERALPWTLPVMFVDAPTLDLTPAHAEVLSASAAGGTRHVQVRLRSPRGAPTIVVFFPAGRRVAMTIAGQVAVQRPAPSGSLVGLAAVPSEGVVVDLDASGSEPIAVTLFDRSFGVPPGTRAESVVYARPPAATPFQDGDVTVMTTQLSL